MTTQDPATDFEQASPQTGADHFRTASMHAMCARQLVRGPEGEHDRARAERHRQYDGHMQLAAFHQGQAQVLLAVVQTPAVTKETSVANNELSAWRTLLTAPRWNNQAQP